MDKLQFRWQSYSDHVGSMLHEMRKSNDLTDVTLVCDDKTQLSAHRVVLSSCSPVFRSIFSNSFQNVNSVIYLRGVGYQEMESILEFIYIGEASIEQNKVAEFFNLANSLEIKDIGQEVNKQAHIPKSEPELNRNLKISEETVVVKRINEDFSDINMVEEYVVTDEVVDELNKVQSAQEKNESFENIEKNYFECTQCKKVYSSKTGLWIHERTFHVQAMPLVEENEKLVKKKDGEESILGENLDRTVKSVSEIDSHHIETKEKKYYECNVKKCNKLFKTPAQLKTHEKGVHPKLGAIVFSCDKCTYTSNYKSNLNAHNVRWHSEGKSFKTYKCETCDREYKASSSLREHINLAHRGEIINTSM